MDFIRSRQLGTSFMAHQSDDGRHFDSFDGHRNTTLDVRNS